MKQLLYCVLWSESVQNLPSITGVQEQQIKFVSHANLACVVSQFDSTQTSLDVQTLMTYHKVVDNCFKHGALIPFRFRTVLNDENEVMSHLLAHGTEYERKLMDLKGKTEMGIRLIVENNPLTGSRDEAGPELNLDAENPGKSYLARRKELYMSHAALDSKCQAIVEELKNSLKGVFIDVKVDPLGKNLADRTLEKETLISVYYLVETGSVERFRTAVEKIRPFVNAKVLVSGPWAPYNFV